MSLAHMPNSYAERTESEPRRTNQHQSGVEAEASVKLYVTNTCPWCRRLESYLDRRGVNYTKLNVSTDVNAARAMVRKSGHQGVPQAEIDGTMVVGFDKARIDQLLRLPRE